MATAISRRVRRKRVIKVRIAVRGMIGRRVRAAVEISPIKRWPAVRLAVSRTPRASGRIRRLMVSIIMRTGIRGVGVPSGRRWLRAAVGWFRIPRITVESQRGIAIPRLRESWVVGVKVYGRRPRMLRVIINIIKDIRMVAHL